MRCLSLKFFVNIKYKQNILKGEFGELPIEIPRDRQGSFEPQIISKHQTRWTGFDDKILCTRHDSA